MYNNDNNRSNYRGNNQKLNNVHEEVRKARKNLPYTFIPVSNKKNAEKVVEAKFNQTEKDNEKLFNGHLDCSMFALNYLIVGNEHNDPEEFRAKMENRFDDNFKSINSSSEHLTSKI